MGYILLLVGVCVRISTPKGGRMSTNKIGRSRRAIARRLAVSVDFADTAGRGRANEWRPLR